jgi:hypothetical protein
MVVMLRVTTGADPLVREDLAFSLSVVLLGLLMMVTRQNAVSQVVGFMSLENGLVLAATGAKGMPFVVEISVAFSILIAFIVIGIFLFAFASGSILSTVCRYAEETEWARRSAFAMLIHAGAKSRPRFRYRFRHRSMSRFARSRTSAGCSTHGRSPRCISVTTSTRSS